MLSSRLVLALSPHPVFRTCARPIVARSYASDSKNAKEQLAEQRLDEERVGQENEQKAKSTIPGLHGWSEEHASESEATVKAERHTEDHSIEDLQKHTVAIAHEDHHGTPPPSSTD